jgi:diguanylate cyclase (GGDEF)-like protein/PAS domain S-box-containing protein
MTENEIAILAEKSESRFYDRLLNNLQEAVNILDPALNVIFWNVASAQMTGYAAEEVLGQACLKNVLIDPGNSDIVPCSKGCPVAQVLEDGNVRGFDAYLQHKQGHRFPVHMRIIPIKSQEGEIIAAVETFREQIPKVTLPQSEQELSRMGLLDPLTSMGNQRYLEMHLNSRLEEMKQLGFSFGLLFIDVDGMENIRETYGSAVADKVLKMISQTLSSSTRFFEVVGRWDREQFLVVLLNIDLMRLDLVANKLRLLVEQSNLREDDLFIKTTVSIGATLAKSRDSAASLVERAEKLAEHSKWLGKNRVSVKLDRE